MFIQNRSGTDLIETVVMIMAVALVAITTFVLINQGTTTSADSIQRNISATRIPVFPME